MILNSLRIPYTAIDIAAPGHEDETDFMRANAKKLEGQRHVLPPQIFNGEKYCGVRLNNLLYTYCTYESFFTQKISHFCMIS